MPRRRGPGTVYLIGAGPGDPALITVRGRALLQRADVVVCDALVPAGLLTYAREGAEIVRVARRGRRQRQGSINRLLVNRARRGLLVARLKGGDPGIFGRLGEEAEWLADSGVPFEIIPGISAAIGAAAAAGIPLTHRDYASSVAFLTGRTGEDGERCTIDWRGLAGADTVVLYMSVRRLEEAIARLVRAGRKRSTPAAIVQWATLPEQRVVTGTLSSVADKARQSGVRPPAILIAGDVVSLRRRLAWFERRPLAGRTIVVTRPRDQARSFSALLEESGARVIESPAIEIRPPRSWKAADRAIDTLSSYGLLIFTSVNGADRFFERLTYRGVDIRDLKGIDVYAIGPATADAVRTRGVLVAAVPEDHRAEGVAAILARRPLVGERILIPRAEIARDMLPREIKRRGAYVDVVSVYRAIPSRRGLPEVRTALREGGIDMLTFTSSSTVTRFSEGFRTAEARRRLRAVPVAAIGPITAATARRCGYRVAVMPRRYTTEALAGEILRWFRSSLSGTPRGSSRPARRGPDRRRGAGSSRHFSPGVRSRQEGRRRR